MGPLDIDVEIERSAVLLIRQYGDDAKLEAALRHDEFLENGDWLGALMWRRVLEAIERQQAKVATRGKAKH